MVQVDRAQADQEAGWRRMGLDAVSPGWSLQAVCETGCRQRDTGANGAPVVFLL
uniref:Uncharacterized protein n=1 Tax=Setaria italica TaxID=4555 RepID=K3YBM3_SETIT